MIDLFEALKDRWDAKSMATTFTGGAHAQFAHKDASFPFVIFESGGTTPEIWTSDGEFQNASMTLHIFSNSKGSSSSRWAEAGRILKVLKAAFDFAPLTLGSGEGSILEMRRTNENILIEDSPDGDVIHSIIEYEILRQMTVDYSPS